MFIIWAKAKLCWKVALNRTAVWTLRGLGHLVFYVTTHDLCDFAAGTVYWWKESWPMVWCQCFSWTMANMSWWAAPSSGPSPRSSASSPSRPSLLSWLVHFISCQKGSFIYLKGWRLLKPIHCPFRREFFHDPVLVNVSSTISNLKESERHSLLFLFLFIEN